MACDLINLSEFCIDVPLERQSNESMSDNKPIGLNTLIAPPGLEPPPGLQQSIPLIHHRYYNPESAVGTSRKGRQGAQSRYCVVCKRQDCYCGNDKPPPYLMRKPPGISINDHWRTPKSGLPRLNDTHKNRKNIKRSVGIACCRMYKGKPQVLVVQKRYSYAYCNFIHGQYNIANNNNLRRMINGMTVEEKLDILTFDFEKIWYRIWLNSTKLPVYYTAKAKFERLIAADNGEKIKKMIDHSSSTTLLWEIPKGRKSRSETDISAAVREFEEETNIPKPMYKLYPFAKIKYQFTDDNTTYAIQYHIAITKKNITPAISFNSKEQVKEISAIKWMSIEEIRFVDDKKKHLEQVATQIFKYVKKRIKDTV